MLKRRIRKSLELRAEKNIKGLEEKRAEIQEKINALVDALEKDEKRASFNEDEAKQYNALIQEKELIETSIKAINAKRAAYNILKDEPSNDNEDKEKLEERAFANYIRGIVEQRADVNLTTGDNGAVIPSSIANKIIKKVHDISPLYQLATKYNVKGTLSIPYYDESSSTITMAYATEFKSLESTSGKFLSIELKGFLAGALSKIAKSLVNNSQFDIVSEVINIMADSIARWIENELINGTDNKIQGLRGVTQTVTSAAATALTADELIDVQEEVPDVYQADAIWIMNRSTRKAIRKLKNSDGDYILNKDPNSKWGYTLFGKDIYTTENMPSIAASKTVIYYGDMSGLAVKLSEDVNIEILREKFAEQHALGVIAWCEIDSKVENAQKIAKLVMKSA
jgi:HK97 family phage major capsid protein